MSHAANDRTPAMKLGLAILIGLGLIIPLFMTWLLVYDRERQSIEAQASIAEGWGGPQRIAGPLLVIPYRATVTESVTENGKAVTRSREVWRAQPGAGDGGDLDGGEAGAASALDL